MTSAPTTSQPGDLRVSDAERDAVVAELSEHFQAGRLNAEEFDQRAGQALAARTRSDLTGLMTDLPGGAQALTRPTASAAGVDSRPSSGRFLSRRTVSVLVVIAAVATVGSLLGHVSAYHIPWALIPVTLLVLRGFRRRSQRARQ
jgi:hypothetical protein